MRDRVIANADRALLDMAHHDGGIGFPGELHASNYRSNSIRPVHSPDIFDTAIMTNQPVVLVVPPIASGRLTDPELESWLSRGDGSVAPRDDDLLTRVLSELGLAHAADGLAALRYLGDTGNTASGFVCCADPVHFQTRMRDLVVHSLSEDQVTEAEVASLMETLQTLLGGEEGMTFIAAGRHGYLLSDAPFETARIGTRSASGTVADRFMPSGPAAREYHRLQSEIQMVLHDHAVNNERDNMSLPRISSLWFWGGGALPVDRPQVLPPFAGKHGLLKGYWAHAGAQVCEPHGNDAGILSPVTDSGVFDFTTLTNDELVAELRTARQLLSRRRIRRLSVVSQDGVCVRLRNRHRWRFWKTGSPLLGVSEADE